MNDGRRAARRWAMKLLYQMEIQKDDIDACKTFL